MITDTVMDGVQYDSSSLERAYEDCTFRNCSFGGMYLGDRHFGHCSFVDCDLSNTTWDATQVKDCQFINSTMIGTDLSPVSPFLLKMTFKDCKMEYAEITGLQLKATSWVNCVLTGADFSGSNLSGSTFDDCQLATAVFSSCNLTDCDFSQSKEVQFDLDKNKVKRAKFTYWQLPPLLSKYHLDITNDPH